MAVDIEQHITLQNLRRYLELKLRIAASRRLVEESEAQIKTDTEELARLAVNLGTNVKELLPDVAAEVRR